jgi:hypothetical protein
MTLMPESHVNLSLQIASLFVAFAIDFACTGDPIHAYDHATARRTNEQDEEQAIENLFWD